MDNHYSITMAIGVLAGVLLIIDILTVVVSVMICLKKRGSTDEQGNNVAYDYPAVDQNNTCFITPMRNEAYAVIKINNK